MKGYYEVDTYAFPLALSYIFLRFLAFGNTVWQVVAIMNRYGWKRGEKSCISDVDNFDVWNKLRLSMGEKRER